MSVRLKWQKVAMMVLPLLILILIVAAWWRQPSCNTSYRDDHTFRSVLHYCNSPSLPMTGQEGTVPPSDGFQLESVYVAIRHGDRSNIHSLPNYDNIKLSCQMEGDEHVSDPSMQQYVATMKEQTGYHKTNPRTSAFHDYDLYPQRSTCRTGMLTPIGATQHVRNGGFLHKRYVGALGLFKGEDDVKLVDKIMVRSTQYSRTFQSAAAFLFGFLADEFDMSKIGFELAQTNTMCSVDQTGASCQCPSIEANIDTMASTYLQFAPEVMSKKRVRATYEEFSEVFGVVVGQLPKPSHLFDTSMVHVCHAHFLPGPGSHPDTCIHPWAANNIHSIINDNGKRQMSTREYQRTARLKMYPVLSEIVQHMEKRARRETNTVFNLFSGHDSTIDPLALVLNMSDGRWPRYAARVVLELYSTGGGSGKTEKVMLVRALYDGDVMTHRLPGCETLYKRPDLGLCEFSHFKKYITEDFLTQFGHKGDYKKLCKA